MAANTPRREGMTKSVTVKRELGEITGISIKGEPIKSEDGETWILPKGLLAGLGVNELPANVTFDLCDRYDDPLVVLDSIPTKIERVGKDQMLFTFEETWTRKHWDGAVTLQVYMEAMRAIVEARVTQVGQIGFGNCADD